MIIIQDVWTAIDRGYEYISALQYDLAANIGIVGDITLFDTGVNTSIELLAYIEALEELDLNHNIAQNKIIERLYNNIKILTKEII